MNKKWKEKTTFEKAISIISTIALCVWLLFEVLEKRSSLQYAKFINYIASSILCICGAISFWKVKRSVSYVAIGGTVCMLAALILEILLLS